MSKELETNEIDGIKETPVENGSVLLKLGKPVLSLIATLREKIAGKTTETEQKRELSPEEIDALVSRAKYLFDNPPEHYYKQMKDFKAEITWVVIERSLRNADPAFLWSLNKLSEFGGAIIDVVGRSSDFKDERSEKGLLYFGDCSECIPREHWQPTYKKAEKQTGPLGVGIIPGDLWLPFAERGRFEKMGNCLLETDENTLAQGLVYEGRNPNVTMSGSKHEDIGPEMITAPNGDLMSDLKSSWRGVVGIKELTA